VLGEAALLTGRPRNATVVVAGAAVRCVEISHETFDQARPIRPVF
jgi:CRP-like cAMP-binding protein